MWNTCVTRAKPSRPRQGRKAASGARPSMRMNPSRGGALFAVRQGREMPNSNRSHVSQFHTVVCEFGCKLMIGTGKQMPMRQVFFAILAVAASTTFAAAQEFQVVKSTSVTTSPVRDLKAKTILFNDHRDDTEGGFIKFEDWSKVNAAQKQFLSLYPAFTEATVTRNVDGAVKTYKDKLQVYVSEARFLLGKSPEQIALTRYATLAFMEQLDPQIKHEVIK